MSRSRDIIQQIAEARSRRCIGVATAELPLQLFTLEDAFSSLERKDGELLKYFPVALIASLESYLRAAIKNLIDSGDPYLSNAEKPASSVKLDFSLLRAIHGKTITVGELVAHGVPLSRLDHINSVLTHILGENFLEKMRVVHSRWDHEVKGKAKEPILGNADAAFAAVERTFELRHIICHESSSAYLPNFEEIENCFDNCMDFLHAADECLSQIQFPDAPLTQADMNEASGRRLEDKRTELNISLLKVKEGLQGAEIDAFDKAQGAWEVYCEAWALFVADECAEGGTIWPVIYGGVVSASIERRIEEVRSVRRLSDPPEI